MLLLELPKFHCDTNLIHNGQYDLFGIEASYHLFHLLLSYSKAQLSSMHAMSTDQVAKCYKILNYDCIINSAMHTLCSLLGLLVHRYTSCTAEHVGFRCWLR